MVGVGAAFLFEEVDVVEIPASTKFPPGPVVVVGVGKTWVLAPEGSSVGEALEEESMSVGDPLAVVVQLLAE